MRHRWVDRARRAVPSGGCASGTELSPTLTSASLGCAASAPHGTRRLNRPPIASRSALLVALAIALPLYAALAWKFDFVCDDAYISFRYAKHMAQGEGLTFNLGQRPPVEGYSNFLWVIVCALFEALGWDVALWSRILSAACGALLLGLVLGVVRRSLALSREGLIATGLFLVSMPPFAMWTTSGLETMPTALALFLGWERLLGDPERPRGFAAGLALLCAALLRADGAVFAGMVLCGGALAWNLSGRPPRLLRAGLIAAGVLVVGVGAHVAWRWSYYGDWLPNTARVKAGFSLFRLDRGWRYLVSFLLAVPSVLLLLALSLRRAPRGSAHMWAPIAVVTIATSAYAVWVGGDFMPFGRFLFPAVPFVALQFASVWAASELTAPAARIFRLTLLRICPILSLLACCDIVPFPDSFLRRFHFRLDRQWASETARWEEMDLNARRWLMLGRAFALHTRLGESMIIGGIGAESYCTELYVYDTYGIVTPEVVANGVIRPDRSPGHDMAVNESFFFPPPHGTFHDKPTYLGGTMVGDPAVYGGKEAPWWEENLPENWPAHPWSALVDTESYPLPEERGFPPGAVLLLLRFRWASR